LKIGIVSRTDKEDALELDRNIINYLLENKVEVEITTDVADKLPEFKEFATPISEMNSDFVICVGGDGTYSKHQHGDSRFSNRS